MTMTAVNPTLPYAYRLIIPGENQLMYDIINLSTPDISLSKTRIQHQDSVINEPDDTFEIGDISFTIILSDGWLGFKRIVDWMKVAKNHSPGYKKSLSILIFSGDFSIETANMNLIGAWPTTIGSVNFDYQSPDAIVMQLPITLSIDGTFDLS